MPLPQGKVDKLLKHSEAVFLKFGYSCRYSGRYALDVISTTAYGLKIEAQQDKDKKFITMAQKIFDSFEFNIGYVISCEYIRAGKAVKFHLKMAKLKTYAM